MFGFFSSNKTFTATINSGQDVVDVAAGDNLLNAALNAGIAWPHNCRVGSCGTCRCRLRSGTIKPLNDFSYVLDDAELDAGMILACQSRLKSDIELEIDLEPNAINLPKADTVNGVIVASKALTHDILELRVQLANELPQYLAGQYAELAVKGIEAPRSYSFAGAPQHSVDNQVVFHVRLVPGGEMSSWLHGESRTGCNVTLSGPHGTFYLRDSEAPVLCVAGGSGMAPIKALLEQVSLEGFARPVTYLFGARTQKDLYCLEEMDALSTQSKGNFRFIPVLSEESQGSDWDGARGFVTTHIENQGLDLPSCQAYLCGPPPMIDSAIETLNRAGLMQNEIFFDKFLDASHLPGGQR